MSATAVLHTREECQAKDPATCRFHGNPLQALALTDADAFNDALDDLMAEDTTAAPSYRRSVAFPSENLPLAERIIERANRRLERAGVDEQFTYVTETEVRQEEDGDNVEYTRLTLNSPEIRINGYKFVAAHEFTPGGKAVSHYVNADALNSQREIDQRCEHCGSTRHRQRVYWVQDEAGDIKQIGSSCLKEFFGVKPNGLWALDGELDFKGALGNAQGSTVYDSRDLLAVALKDADDRGGFVARNAAYGNHMATADRVMVGWRADELAVARHDDNYLQRADEVLAWARAIPADTDNPYLKNLRTAASEPWVKKKHVPLVVSAVKAHQTEQERQAREVERNAARVNIQQGYYATPGEKIVGVPVKVISSRYFPNDFNGMTMVILETEDGFRLKWNASNAPGFNAGDTAVIKSARVKDNRVYNDMHQTVVSHVSFDAPADE